MSNTSIKTERLLLRSFVDSDQEATVSILINQEVSKTYMLPDFSSANDAIPLFERLKTLSEDSSKYVFAIEANSVVVGFMNEVERNDGQIEVGYVIHPDYQNKGYATEALTALIRYLHKEGFRSVIAGYFVENTASRRVMEKAGMRFLEKTDEIEYRGITHKCHYFECVCRD